MRAIFNLARCLLFFLRRMDQQQDERNQQIAREIRRLADQLDPRPSPVDAATQTSFSAGHYQALAQKLLSEILRTVETALPEETSSEEQPTTMDQSDGPGQQPSGTPAETQRIARTARIIGSMPKPPLHIFWKRKLRMINQQGKRGN